MATTVQQTSLIAYQTVDLLNRQERIMYKVIKSNPNFCNKEISNFLNRPINEITGRVKSLREKGSVVHSGYKYYGGRKVMTWEIYNKPSYLQ